MDIILLINTMSISFAMPIEEDLDQIHLEITETTSPCVGSGSDSDSDSDEGWVTDDSGSESDISDHPHESE